LPYEAQEINENLIEALLLNPLSKIKGSKANLQACYL
jgi:hypothetical protein